MKKYLLVLAILFSLTVAHSQTNISGGSISGTWTLAGSPYLIQGSIFIPQDSILTVQPGVTINFQGTYKLLVLGRLIAIGTITDSIFFTATNTTNGWRGIRFDNTSSTQDSSRFEYCSLSYGKATGTGNDAQGGGFFINNFSKVLISNCRIVNGSANDTGAGICFMGTGSAYINSCTFSGNTAANAGGGIACVGSGTSTILNCIISGNSVGGPWNGAGICSGSNIIVLNCTISNNTGNGIRLFGSTATISGNTISNNSASGYGGGGIRCESNAVINNNTISNNIAGAGGGVFCDNSTNPTISNNTITNNSSNGSSTYDGGGGIYFGNSSNPTLTNNTISNNAASGAGNGGGMYCRFTSNPIFRNCILYGNTATLSGAQVYLNDDGSDPNFYYCNVEGGSAAFGLNFNFYTGTYQNNINVNSQFVSPSSGSGTGFNGVTADWSLQNTSLCINAGDPSGTYPATDKAGNPRVVGSFIDIGAFEFQGNVGIINYDLQNQIIVFPNPFSTQTILQTDNPLHNATLTVDNCFGQTVAQIKNLRGQTITFNRDNLPSGLYFVRLTEDKKTLVVEKLLITD